jgi:UDP-3-O-[3-hydroxymyristoyl] N-acetylglucosamine deacetylase
MRQQRTLRHTIGCAGVGLHSGARTAVTLRPAAEGSGIRFRRVDRPGAPVIAAHPCNAAAADGVTMLGTADGGSVRMVEHLMAALAACEIDNVLIDTSGPELPFMDGSAQAFVRLVECAGAVEQDLRLGRLEIVQSIEVWGPNGRARLEPGHGLEIVVETPDGAGGPDFALLVSPDRCKREVVPARDHGRLDRPGGIEERVRHLALDALGALALLPAVLVGRYVEANASPALRCALLRKLLVERRCWRWSGIAPVDHAWPAAFQPA